MHQLALDDNWSEDDSDTTLVQKVVNGNINAYEGIMRRNNQLLFRLARSIVNADADAMDIVQESYILAFERLQELENPKALTAWLCKIVRNKSLMHLRTAGRLQETDPADFDNIISFSPTSTEREQPENELANAQLSRLLEMCIDQLPLELRSVFVLRAIHHCDVRSVAQILDIKEPTVKTRLHRARLLLQKRLLEHDDAMGLALYRFSGARCDAVVHKVLRAIARTGGK